jgi:hypothetical protein
MEQILNNERNSTMNLEIIKMEEAEAYFRTVTDRLWEHRNFMKDHLMAWEAMSQYIDSQAEDFYKWKYTKKSEVMAQNILDKIENTLKVWEVPSASPIGHTVGYNQY